MPFVIFNPKTSRYLKHPNTWTPLLKNAAKFQTLEKANNFMVNNFPHVCQITPASDVQILDVANLTIDFQPQYSFTEETAAEELNNLNDFVTTMMESSEKLAALPAYYGKVVQSLDLETLDILHKIEFAHVNVVGGYRLFKQLQDVRLRRRSAKDALERSSLLLSSGLLTSIKSLHENLDKLNADMEDRSYRPRVLTEMFGDPEETEDAGVAS